MYIHDTPPSEYLCLKRTRKAGALTLHSEFELNCFSRLGISIVLAVLAAVEQGIVPTRGVETVQ